MASNAKIAPGCVAALREEPTVGQTGGVFGLRCQRLARVCGVFATWLLVGVANASPTPEPEEKMTAPPPLGGRPSIGTPPPPRFGAAAVATEGDRPVDVGLERQADGSFVYVDPARMFTMTVRPDGRVLFADRWRRPSAGNAQHGKVGRRPGGPMLISLNVFGGAGVRGPLEFLMQATGHDLAANAKRAALAETRGFRTQLAIGWTKARVRKRLAELPAELLALWSDSGISVEERRRIVFDRWDECEDRLGVPMDGLPADAVVEVDEVRRAAADRARREIEGFIRRSAPAGSAKTFSPRELERFNHARVSVERFDPYQTGAPVPRGAPGGRSKLPSKPSKLPSKLPGATPPVNEGSSEDATAKD